MFLVKWKGFSEAHDTWQTEDDLENAKEKIEEFKERRGNKID